MGKYQRRRIITTIGIGRMLTYVSCNLLKSHPKNPNKHTPAQIDRLCELIKYQGFRVPIIVSNQSGYIVSGHGRLEAAIKLGMAEVPVYYQDFKDEEQEYAFLVSDNAISSWAELDLSGINIEIANLGPDFNIDLLGVKDFKIDYEPDLPKIEDFENIETEKQMKFYTCPYCEKEFEERQAQVRKE